MAANKLASSIDYIASIREEVNEIEARLAEIKKSDEWKNSMGYLRVAACNGTIDEPPSKYNNYRIPTILTD